MPSYSSYMRQMSVLDKDDDITWITVKGNHIPIKKGQSKGDAVKEFFESKKSGEKKTETNNTPKTPELKKGQVKLHRDIDDRDVIIDPDGSYTFYKGGVKGSQNHSLKGKEGALKELGELGYKQNTYVVTKSEIEEAFEDFPKFKIKKDYAVAENDNKRVVVEKYSDGVIGVTTETEGGELLNSAEFKSWESAATYANKQRILHKISLGEDK